MTRDVKPPQTVRVTKVQFITAFMRILNHSPERPPSPKAISKELGLGNADNLNGRMNRLRLELLKANGFVKDEELNRWVRRLPPLPPT